MTDATFKVYKYSGFALATLIIFAGFLTAKTYAQLAASAALYPVLIFLGMKAFPRKKLITEHVHPVAKYVREVTEERPQFLDRATTSVNDMDKRAFIKLIGAAGVSFLVLSVLGRRLDSLFFGQKQTTVSGQTGSTDKQSGLSGSSITEGYKISEIEEGIVSYYGFVNKEGGWLIMREDADNGTFRYTKGNSDFAYNWHNRENLSYDYYHNLF